MAVIAEFEFWSSEMALADTFEAVSDVELDVIREVATDPETPILFFWARGDDLDAFERAATADETVAAFERYSEKDDEVLYRLRISERTEVVVYPAWVDLGAELLDEGWQDGRWHARMRFPDYETLQGFRQWCADNGVSFELRSVYTGHSREESDLTDAQREALTLALERGFFEVPRQTTMADLADVLGVSEQAVSERLRRGLERLVRRHVSATNG